MNWYFPYDQWALQKLQKQERRANISQERSKCPVMVSSSSLGSHSVDIAQNRSCLIEIDQIYWLKTKPYIIAKTFPWTLPKTEAAYSKLIKSID